MIISVPQDRLLPIQSKEGFVLAVATGIQHTLISLD